MKKKTFSLLFLGFGIFILIQVIMPILEYKIWETVIYNQNISLISPDPGQKVLGISIENEPSIKNIGVGLLFRNNKDNFPAIISNSKRLIPPAYQSFYLSIPSLKLANLKVVVDTNDFEQNLAHLPGSGLPGEKGNTFITGHSSLPQLFRPGNFKAIFAHLPEIKKGESIILDAGGQKFEYIVSGLKIVDPKETWVINPPEQNGRYLTLMTCVPPGLYLKRLIVLAEIK
ncbi:MAG: class E sortase [Candidatus Daviesbacteria bacterium]|nr:class E sortase [Candidatus Daviesbacteria bacterium]